jgi:amino acid adenylation domain-containing protein
MPDRISSDKLTVAAQQKSKEESYWLNRLSGEFQKTVFSYDFNRVNGREWKLDELGFGIEGAAAKKIIELINNSDVRLYIVLMAALILLLQKYTGNNDVIIGAPIYKQETEAEFINTVLPLRYVVQSRNSFKELLLQVGQVLLEATKHQNYPIERLLYHLGISYVQEEDFPLFDIAILLDTLHDRTYLGHLNFNLCFVFEKKNGNINGLVQYNSLLYRRETVEKISRHFLQLLQEAVFNLGVPAYALNVLLPEEREKILFQFNDTEAQFPESKTMCDLFEAQVKRSPDTIAIVEAEGNRQISYHHLHKRTVGLALTLIEKGVRPGTIVAEMLERSLDMLIGIFGILKAGGAYLPIDPEYPQARVEYLLKDSRAGFILSRHEYNEKSAAVCEFIDLEDEEVFCKEKKEPEKLFSPQNIAYTIYTSGSTGKPKGVLIEHRSVVNRLNWMQKSYPLNSGDVILQKTSFTFDVSVWELFWWSFQGASLCLLKPKDEISPEQIVKAIEKHLVTTIHFVPTMLNYFLEYVEHAGNIHKLSCLKYIFSSGEALHINQVERFYRVFQQETASALINLYGPTEATVDVSYYNCRQKENDQFVPIGKPIDNIKLFIVDKDLQFKPIGTTGELSISGVGLARGYLNRPELTAEKFVENPISPGEQLYKTGDLARFFPDGNIEFVGRIDHQVKIRGFRVELGEIENLLQKKDDIKDAIVVVTSKNGGDKYLCAYMVPAGPDTTDLRVSELREYLLKKLPEYMVPSYFVQLQSLPLLSNGKVDRKALPEPQSNISTGVEFVAPESDVEKQVADIWKEVLGVDRVSIYESFFELGGNSIKLIEVNNRLKEILNRDIPIITMFRFPTVSAIAQFLDQDAQDDGSLAPTNKRLEAEERGKNKLKNLRKRVKSGEARSNDRP